MNVIPQGGRVLRIAVAADQRLADWQALLIDRLAGDKRFDLCGRVPAGQGPLPDGSLAAAARAALRAERWALRRHLRRYPSEQAEDTLRCLPWVSRQGQADAVLALGTPALAADLSKGKIQVLFGGMACPDAAAFDAVSRKAPSLAVSVVRQEPGAGAPEVLAASEYNVKPGAVLTGAFAGEKAVLLTLKTLAQLARGGTPGSNIQGGGAAGPGRGLWHYGAGMAGAAVKKLSERRALRAGRAREFWQLLGGNGGALDADPAQAEPLARHRFLMADPFLFRHRGALWVFYEAMGRSGRRGWIEAAPLTGGGLGTPVKALERSYHLSFPHVFGEGGEIYMMPETQAARQLEVWRAVAFPDRWELHATAFEGEYLADSILHKDEAGRWWLLTGKSEHYNFQDHSSELYLYRTDGPGLGQITPHWQNPVVTGSTTARNAGPLIREGGRLFRPSQNNSHGVYGYGLNLMEVLQMDEGGYRERLVRAFTPADRPGSLAIHHISAAAGRYVMDAAGREGRG